MEDDDDVRALRRRTRDAETIARLTRIGGEHARERRARDGDASRAGERDGKGASRA